MITTPRLFIAGAAIAAITAVPALAYAAPSTPAPKPPASSTTASAAKVSLTPPTGRHGDAIVLITGLKPDQAVDMYGAPAGWTKEAPYYYEGFADRSGTIRFRVGARRAPAGDPTLSTRGRFAPANRPRVSMST
ncbi:hypothetical protein [Mariniluteicoccus flavus]